MKIPNHQSSFLKNPEMEENWNPFGPNFCQATKVLSKNSRNDGGETQENGHFQNSFPIPNQAEIDPNHSIL